MNKILHMSTESVFDMLYSEIEARYVITEDYDGAICEMSFHYHDSVFIACRRGCDEPAAVVTSFVISNSEGIFTIERIESVDIYPHMLGVDELHTHFLSCCYKQANGAISHEGHNKLMALPNNERDDNTGVFIALDDSLQYIDSHPLPHECWDSCIFVQQMTKKIRIFADFARVYEHFNRKGLFDLIVQYADTITIAPCGIECFYDQEEKRKKFIDYKNEMKTRIERMNELESTMTAEEYHETQMSIIADVKKMPKCLNCDNHTNIRAKHFIEYGDCGRFAGIASKRAYRSLEKAETVFGMSYLFLRGRAAFNLSETISQL